MKHIYETPVIDLLVLAPEDILTSSFAGEDDSLDAE